MRQGPGKFIRRNQRLPSDSENKIVEMENEEDDDANEQRGINRQDRGRNGPAVKQSRTIEDMRSRKQKQSAGNWYVHQLKGGL